MTFARRLGLVSSTKYQSFCEATGYAEQFFDIYENTEKTKRPEHMWTSANVTAENLTAV